MKNEVRLYHFNNKYVTDIAYDKIPLLMKGISYKLWGRMYDRLVLHLHMGQLNNKVEYLEV